MGTLCLLSPSWTSGAGELQLGTDTAQPVRMAGEAAGEGTEREGGGEEQVLRWQQGKASPGGRSPVGTCTSAEGGAGAVFHV